MKISAKHFALAVGP